MITPIPRFSSVASVILSSVVLSVASAQAQERVLAFGDSNTWGWIPNSEGLPSTRYDDLTRWPGVLGAELSPDAIVIVDGLVGRTTDLDGNTIGALDGQDFNGSKNLGEAVARHAPIDLVVIMLGTNDLQSAYGRSAYQIARSAFSLAADVRDMEQPVFTTYPAPSVLVVSPPALGSTSSTSLRTLFEGGEATSRALALAFAREAGRIGMPFFDAGEAIRTDGIDGVHLSAEMHARLGEALAPIVAGLLRARRTTLPSPENPSGSIGGFHDHNSSN